MSLPETRFSLLSRLKDPDDVVAWQEFIAIYESALIGFCRRFGVPDHDASEVVQEVWVAVHQTIDTWQPSGSVGGLRAWLFETTRRRALQSLRQRRRPDREPAISLDLIDESTWPAGLPSHGDAQTNVERSESQWMAFHVAASIVKRQVNESTWRAFWDTAVSGKSATLVAKENDMTVGGVYTAKCRVLVRIRNVISDMTQSNDR